MAKVPKAVEKCWKFRPGE